MGSLKAVSLLHSYTDEVNSGLCHRVNSQIIIMIPE